MEKVPENGLEMGITALKSILTHIPLKNIMNKNVISVSLDEHFSAVPHKMRAHKIRHLPVVDDKYKLVGIITQRDLFKTIAPKKLEEGGWVYDDEELNQFVIGQVMNPKVKALLPWDTVAEAVSLMVHRKYGGIPIVKKNGNLYGIVTQHDVLKIAADLVEG